MQRVIPITINIKTGTTDSQIVMYRGDNVKFQFSFTDASSVSLDTATKLRVQVKPANDLKASYTWFAGETTITSEDYSIEFTSSQTSGYSGNGFLAVLVLDANDETVCTAGIPMRVEPSGYEGIFTPSEDFRDETIQAKDKAEAAASAAASAAENCTSLKEQCERIKTQTQSYSSQASDNATKAEGYAVGTANSQDVPSSSPYYHNNAKYYNEQCSTTLQACNDVKTTTETYKNAAESAKNAAELAKEQAQEISDPENRIGILQILKQNDGQLYLNGGYGFTNCKPTFGAAQSLLFTYEVSEAELDASPWSIIGNAHIWSGQKGIGFAKNTSNKIQCGFNWSGNTTERAFIETNTTFADGKPHTWALVCGKNATNGFFKLYCDGVLIGSKTNLALFDDFIPTYGFYLGKAQAGGSADISAKGRLSRIAFFNFDVSESNAGYTLNDYQSGKSIPPSLLDATEGNRAVLNLENYTIARNTTTRLIKDLSAGGYDATVSGEIRGDMDRRVEVFVDELKTQIAQSTATTTE